MTQIKLNVPSSLPVSAQWAVKELSAAIARRGCKISDSAGDSIDIVLGKPAATAPESLAIEIIKPNQARIAGADARGLVYALLEAADAIEWGDATSPLDNLKPCRQSPSLPWRSMQLFLNNQKLEAEWYFDDAFWEGYLHQLARCRYNNLTLTFSHQNSYLAPPYPFHVELPEFPTIRTPSCDDAHRRRNLEMLQRISTMTRQRGMHFSLGVWQQHECEYGPAMVEGLTPDIIGDVNATGLQRLLEACPNIDGLQFRMNAEAGVPEDRQEEYWQKQFAAIASVRRPIHVDIRAKGLSNQTIARAQSLLSDVAVSTKFWCEHMGMPYVMPAIQRHDVPQFRRYGTWDMLRKPRPFKLIHQYWTAGSQRLLLWGDDEHVRRFARSCAAHGDGFEVMAPLNNKGGRNEGGAWPIFKDPSLLPFEFEYERYWLFYELFGRLGYDADAEAASWQRQFRRRFGPAGKVVEEAVNVSSQIIPLLTTVLQFAAGMWGFWPEMFAGRTLVTDITIEPSDPTQFYGMEEYAEAALKGKVDGRWTPWQTASKLRELSQRTRNALEKAAGLVKENHREFPATRHDLLVLANLADYHAHRLEAGTCLALAGRSASRPRLLQAIEAMTRAVAQWRELVARTDGVYADDLIFGLRDRGHAGHWRDQLKVAERDLHELQERDANVGPDIYPHPLSARLLPGEKNYPSVAPPTVDVPAKASAGKPITVSLTWRDKIPAVAVTCHVKSMLQTHPFIALPMREQSPGRWSANIDAKDVTADWDLILFFQIDLPDGEAVRYPDWREANPYLTIRTAPQ